MKPLYLHACLLLIVGCTPVEQYRAPANAPQAQIRSELDALHNRHNSLTVDEPSIMGCHLGMPAPVRPGRQLFSVSGNTSKPASAIAVEAGRPLMLILKGSASENRQCVIDFTREYAPGGHYVIRGGIVDNSNDLGRCQIDVFDEDSGAELPEIKVQAPKEVVCGLAKHLRLP